MKYALVLILFAPLAAFADCSTNWMECSADSPLGISSFTMRATETIGAITAARNLATQRLTSRTMTVDAAKGVLAQTDTARSLWNQARAVCHADPAGNCDAPDHSKQAFDLLAQAQQILLVQQAKVLHHMSAGAQRMQELSR